MGFIEPKINYTYSRLGILSLALMLNASAFGAEIDPSLSYVKKVLQRILSHEKTKANKPSDNKPDITGAYKIVQYLSAGKPSVIISAGSNQGVVDEAILYSYRQKASPFKGKSPAWIKTGKLKAFHVDKDFTLARVVAPGNETARAFFPKYPIAMAGDTVSEARFKIVKNPILTPTKSLIYKRLFVDPMADPVNFELTEEGKERLREMAEVYKKLHVPILMIESYTDPTGPSDANQVESYQRALTVRHFMVDRLGFEASRVVAIGYGESNQINHNYLSGYQDANRRIVFKVNVHVAPHH
jgi:hypothetical protein